MDPNLAFASCLWIYNQERYLYYFQHNGQLKFKHSCTTNWPLCFAAIRINWELTLIWNSTSTTSRTQPQGSLSRGGFMIFQRRSILHKQWHNLFNTSLNMAKRSIKTKLAHWGGCHVQFIKLVQRMVSTPYSFIRCHSLATKPWSLLTKIIFSLLLAPLRQYQYQHVPWPWAAIYCKHALTSSTEHLYSLLTAFLFL